MKKIGLLIFCGLMSTGANASILSGEVANDAYVTVGGYDIAWGSPCSDGLLEASCGAADLSEQAGYGWNIMTSTLFTTLNISASTFIVDYSSSNTQSYAGANYAYATGWFSNNYSYIDVENGMSGNWSFADIKENAIHYETIFYRESTNVPAPASALLLGLGLAGIGFSRRKKSANQA